MTKKLITISVILTMAMTLGLVGITNAAYNSVSFAGDTTIGVSDLVANNGGQVASFVVNDNDTATMTLSSGSHITITSAAGHIMELNYPIVATATCTAGVASITIPYNSTYPTVILSLTSTDCDAGATPTIDSIVVGSSTTLEVTFSENIAYVTDSAALLAASTNPPSFAGLTPSSTSISGRVLTLTFTSGALAGAGVKDDSVLILPDAQIEETTSNTNYGGTTDTVVTDLASINQLYDFVFAIQVGDNFMSVPYNVKGPDGTAVNTAAKVGDTYADTTGIYTYTITDATAGAFASATSFAPLYGYHINSAAATTVYLRVNENTASLVPFERTFAAVGWHIMGVASDNADDAVGQQTDDDILSSLTTPSSETLYDRVYDVSVGKSTDINDSTTPDETYDVSVYKALLTNLYRRVQTAGQMSAANATGGIEFNHGEAYFIYITGANAKYIGERATDANLLK